MVIKITRWSPDTCGCTIDYEWDTEVPASERIHTLKEFIKICNKHRPSNTISSNNITESVHQHSITLYEQVVEENRRKNLAKDSS